MLYGNWMISMYNWFDFYHSSPSIAEMSTIKLLSDMQGTMMIKKDLWSHLNILDAYLSA